MLSIYGLLLSVGVVQGLLSGLLLLVAKNKQLSMIVLAIIMIVCSLVNLRYLGHVSGFFQSESYQFSHTNIALLLCPLAYLYVLSILQRNLLVKRIFLLHFIPSLMYLSCDLFTYYSYMDHYISNKLYFSLICTLLKNSSIESLLTVVSCAVYLYLTFLKLKEFGLEKIVISFSTTHMVCHWIRVFIVSIFLLTFFYIYNLQLQGSEHHLSNGAVGWQMFHIFILFFVYYHGFIGLRRPDFDLYSSIVSMQSKDKKRQRVDVDSIKLALLKKLQDDQVYLNPTLSISKLAEMLQTSSESLSFVINQEFEMKFRDYINSYRIEEAKLKFQNMSSNNKSILSISLDSGFNSQASFYRAFKRFEGMTPKKYIANFQ